MRTALTAIASVALTACNSAPAISPGASARASLGAGGSVAASVPAHTSVSVDLVFTGSLSIVAKGSAGRCSGLTRADGTVSFGFEATEADYPGLGTAYSMANLQGDYVDIKWVVDASTAYARANDNSVVLSADHHSVQIDGDLAPFPPAGPEHVSGTITCP